MNRNWQWIYASATYPTSLYFGPRLHNTLSFENGLVSYRIDLLFTPIRNASYWICVFTNENALMKTLWKRDETSPILPLSLYKRSNPIWNENITAWTKVNTLKTKAEFKKCTAEIPIWKGLDSARNWKRYRVNKPNIQTGLANLILYEMKRYRVNGALTNCDLSGQ